MWGYTHNCANGRDNTHGDNLASQAYDGCAVTGFHSWGAPTDQDTRRENPGQPGPGSVRALCDSAAVARDGLALSGVSGSRFAPAALNYRPTSGYLGTARYRCGVRRCPTIVGSKRRTRPFLWRWVGPFVTWAGPCLTKPSMISPVARRIACLLLTHSVASCPFCTMAVSFCSPKKTRFGIDPHRAATKE